MGIGSSSAGRRRHRPPPPPAHPQPQNGGRYGYAGASPPYPPQYPNEPIPNPGQYHQYPHQFPNGPNPNQAHFYQYSAFYPPPPIPGAYHRGGAFMGPPPPGNWVPGQYPYGAPPPLPGAPFVEHQKTVTIKNDVNIKKDSLRVEPDEENPGKFVVAFTFDAAAPGSITVMFFTKEDADFNLIATKESLLKPVKVPFDKGLGQKFRQPSGTGIDFSMFEEIGLTKEGDIEVYPLVVKAEAHLVNEGERESEGNSTGNSQITQAVFEKKENGEYKVRVVKQILWVDNMRYELQEIYGIGNAVEGDQNDNEAGKDCIICLSEPRDTTVLPCRHMCMCSGCAKVLRFQTNRCPVCRQPVELDAIMALSSHEVATLRVALQDAVVKCSERCLYQSAKWAAELLNAVHETDDGEHETGGAELKHTSSNFSPNQDADEAALETMEFSKYLLAKSLFDCKEYDRCAAVFLPDSLLSTVLDSRLEKQPSVAAKGKGKSKATDETKLSAVPLPKLSQKSLFLALYAKFMSGEKRKNEESEMVMGPQDLGTVVNKQLLVVGRFLAAWFEERTTDDDEVLGSQGWLEYLYGMVLAKEKNDEKALEFFIRSVHKYPMNWGCWLEMTSLISRVEDLNRISRHCPQNIVSYMFHLHTSLELYQQSAGLANSLDQLLSIFPTSSFLLTCNALLAYHAKDLMAAEQHFSRLLSLHPHRLDSLDHYSNILYVLNLRPKLAFLAHLCSSVDRFRPESCVVIGNYYSLLSMHEKAVGYFRRALTLDRSCLSAWTLMGHEYVELKNTHAAIESYRRAVDVNRRDYRAWYGLGQTYEMLEMHTYSLWYYKKAAGLRPWDGKMWMAVGSCLQKMGRERDGIKALKRALLADAYYDVGSSFGSGGDLLGARGATGQMDPEILLQIATMYDQLGEEEEAKAYMELCMAQEDGGPAAAGNLGESVRIHNDSPGGSPGYPDREDANAEGNAEGTGVTAATSKARMWLAKFAMRTADYATANRLAAELCQDGVEVEEAKALAREVRSRLEASGMLGPAG